MRLTFVTASTVCFILCIRVAADDAAKKDFQRLQGTWTVVAAEKDGEPLDRIKGGKLIVKDVNFTINTASGRKSDTPRPRRRLFNTSSYGVSSYVLSAGGGCCTHS